MFIHDRQITISAAGNRKAVKWPAQTIYWSELVERLKTPVRSTETLAEYLRLPKSRQDDLKDVGGFVGGVLAGSRRKATAITGRDIIALDLDNIPAGNTQDVLRRLEGLGCAYVVYSTRKHQEAKPRLRVLILLNRTATADEYEPLTRKLASIIGIELCDPTTFQATRLMYWPSCCSDSQYVYQYGDKPFLDVDGLLALYNDWRNVAEWPEVPGVQSAHTKLAAKQGDPAEKTGIVGAFCKTYDVYKAMDIFLPGIYEPCDNSPGRYTYTGGSTVGGAVIYDNGSFLYSHHATDPAGGKLSNAFDLVRLHKFNELDDEAKPDTPTNKLPSYQAMCQLAINDAFVANLLNQERYEKATQEFSQAPDNDTNWMAILTKSSTTGTPLKTTSNVLTVLANDPLLKGKIRKDLFADKIIGCAPLPWPAREKTEGQFYWTDEDDGGLRIYIEKILGFRSREMIEDALRNYAAANSYNPVTDYLNSLTWDEKPRLDSLYIDYLGAEDCPYTRTVTRKAFTAAVARVMTPGCKFDFMTVVSGKQGIGKTTLFEKLGRSWFSNSVGTFEGKEAAELLQGVWIVEIGELGAYSRSDINAVKQFLSKCDDQYRAAYGRKTEKHLRRCVFFGTTNNHDYLKDTTGNRRFWPIDAEIQEPIKSVFNDLDDEINQIWAEAVLRWKLGEPLSLDKEMETEAERRREQHMERDSLQGQIEEFLEKPIPIDWQKWSLDRRRMFWSNSVSGDIKLVERDRICAIEIWKECLGDPRSSMPKIEALRINSVLEALPGWSRGSTARFGAGYGTQKCFKRELGMNKSLKIVNQVGQNVNQVGQNVNHPLFYNVNHVNQKT